MNSKMSKILMLAGILLTLDNALSYYNKSYDGYTFILPYTVMDHNNSWLVQLSSFGAQQWCTENVAGSTLATIRNKDAQQDFIQFIRSALHNNKELVIDPNSNIRLNGQYHITDEWRWVNGHPKSNITIHERNDKLYSFYARLRRENDFSIYSENPDKIGRFICEYPENSVQCSALLNGRCYNQKYTSLTWYDARNTCSDEGGDLASFQTLSDADINVSLENLSLESKVDYWIGMQKNEWRWEDTGSAIKYTDWEHSRPSNNSLQCLCLTRPQWDWKECDCSAPYLFVCILNDTSNSPATPKPLNDTRNSTTTPKPQNENIQFVIIIVSCAVIFVVIIIIAVALITKKRRNSNVPGAVKSSGHENPEYATVETSNDFPVHAEIQEPEEINSASNTVYASVQATAGTDQELPGIVYAELDLTSRA